MFTRAACRDEQAAEEKAVAVENVNVLDITHRFSCHKHQLFAHAARRDKQAAEEKAAAVENVLLEERERAASEIAQVGHFCKPLLLSLSEDLGCFVHSVCAWLIISADVLMTIQWHWNDHIYPSMKRP